MKKLSNKILNKIISQNLRNKIIFTTDLIEKVVPLWEKPSIFNIIRASTGVLQVISELNSYYPEDYFVVNSNWDSTPIRDILVPLVFEQIQSCEYEIINLSSSKSSAVKIINYDGLKLGFIFNKSNPNACNEIYVEEGKMNLLKSKLKTHLWQKFKDSNIVLRRKKAEQQTNKSSLEFVVDDLVDAMPSELAQNYASKFRRAFAVNENRALLLFGPPGSGKSTMARQIASDLGLKSFRLCVEDIDNDTKFLFDLISLFNPDAIIFDDFDRSCQDGSQLELIAHLRKKVKLLIATANDRNAIDEALLRPERFDELGFVDVLDDTIIKKILGDYADEAFEIVRHWPVAFIQEYCRRRKWLSEDEAKDSFIELAERVKRLDSYKSTSDSPMKLLIAKSKKDMISPKPIKC